MFDWAWVWNKMLNLKYCTLTSGVTPEAWFLMTLGAALLKPFTTDWDSNPCAGTQTQLFGTWTLVADSNPAKTHGTTSKQLQRPMQVQSTLQAEFPETSSLPRLLSLVVGGLHKQHWHNPWVQVSRERSRNKRGPVALQHKTRTVEFPSPPICLPTCKMGKFYRLKWDEGKYSA